MNILESIKRWSKVLKSLKHLQPRIERIERDLGMLGNAQYLENVESFKNTLRQKEYQVYSQNGEDGILLYLISQLGIPNGKFVEIGIGNGRQCNTANLSLNFGWTGLLIDGNKDQVISAREYYNNHDAISSASSVKVVHSFVDIDNIMPLLKENMEDEDVDLLSIDIDGNDLWIWKAINTIRPKIVVMEYNASLGKEKSISVPYDPTFYRFDKHKSGWYHGASLRALVKLGKEKSYSLIGCDSEGANAFFVRDDLELSGLEVQEVESAFYPMRKRQKVCNLKDQFETIAHLEFSNY